ncbi:MAG: hypothetical protein Alpg2KO_05100 [Alphaproteobacteria bacterium]
MRPIARVVYLGTLMAWAGFGVTSAWAASGPALSERVLMQHEVVDIQRNDRVTASSEGDRPNANLEYHLPKLKPQATTDIKPERKPEPPKKAIPQDFSQGILIDISDRRLYWVEEGKEVRSFPIAVPREGYRTYYGDSKVGWLRPNPTWTPTPNMRRKNPSLPRSVPPGPNNPLGTKAIGTGWKYIYIHGTNRPESIGTRASSGCFRMHNPDVEWLFKQVKSGTPIRVQP